MVLAWQGPMGARLEIRWGPYKYFLSFLIACAECVASALGSTLFACKKYDNGTRYEYCQTVEESRAAKRRAGKVPEARSNDSGQ